VSGLINAYRNAAHDVILQADIVEKLVEKQLLIEFDYGVMNEVMKIFKDERLLQIDSLFDLKCEIKTQVRLSELNRIEEAFMKIEGVKISELM